MGRFQLGKGCVCSPNVMFRRGHETCIRLPQLPRLSGAEARRKIEMARRLGIGTSATFTDLDFLLNTRQYHRIGRALAAIRSALASVYSERMELAQESALVHLLEGSTTLLSRDFTPLDGTK
jgi:hypothetical protein